MAYNVDKFRNITSDPDNQDPDSNINRIIVDDGTLNKETWLTFVGKNFYGYGESIAQNQMHLMENFASATPPDLTRAVEGQIYYNTQEDVFYYCAQVDDEKDWVRLQSNVVTRIVNDVNSQPHFVTMIYDQTDIISVYSSDPSFEVAASEDDLINNFFNTTDPNDRFIRPGITLNNGDVNGEKYKFRGTATTAEYADLAELYSSDAEYEPGTVVKVGGEAEVTQTTSAFDPEVFGVVSTDPAYLMNSSLQGVSVAVALQGRVPVKCIGQVRKGQRLLSSEEPGVARAPTDYEMQEYMDWYRIVGRALEDKTTEGIGLVEVIVGAK
jgi:hypothetical protein